jgi:MFS family permease
MSEIIARIKHSHKVIPVFIASFFIALHYIVVIYINSSFLRTFLSSRELSILYTFVAAISFVTFLFAPRLVRRVSNFDFLIVIFLLEIIALLTLAFATFTALLIGAFLVYFVSVYAIFYSMDVFLETLTKKEGHTGVLRGAYLTIANLGVIIGPALLSVLAHDNDYSTVYIVAALLLLPAFFIALKYFKNIQEPHISHINISDDVADLIRLPDVRRIVFVNFLLQFFFSWMVVYTPIYLHETLGIPWSSIGLIFSIMLLPFVIFELPVGELADKKFGEKEFLFIGLMIMAVSTAFIALLDTTLPLIWAVVLFLTRVGASIVEVAADTYFFRQVSGKNANLISIYRAMIPLSLIVAPLVFFISSNFLDLRVSFLVLACIIAVGIIPILRIKDTK